MQSWVKRLRGRTGDAADAVADILAGQRVFMHGAYATPRTSIDAPDQRRSELRDVRITRLHSEGTTPYVRPEFAGIFRHEALFVGANVREAVIASLVCIPKCSPTELSI